MASKRTHDKTLLPFLAALLFLNAVIFAPVFRSFLFADDFIQMYGQRANSIGGLVSAALRSSMGYVFRPICFICLGINYHLLRFGIPACYVFSFTAHFIAAVSLFFFLRKLKDDFIFAAAGAMLFITYCGTWEAVGWIAVIYYPVVVSLMLWTVILYLDRKWLLSSIMLTAALLTHETAVMVVPFLIAFEWFSSKTIPLRRLFVLAALTLIYIIFYLLRPFFAPLAGMAGKYALGPHFLINELGYLSTLVIPVITTYKMSALIPVQFVTLIDVLKDIIMAGLPLIIAYAFWKGDRIIKILTVWILLTLLPFAFFITPSVSRYLYIASAGYAGIIAYFIRSMTANVRFKNAGIGVFVLILIFNLAGMLFYQHLFFQKKEVRRHLWREIKPAISGLRPDASLCFIDVPVRDDEIRGMIYLWSGSDRYRIATFNADNAACRQTDDGRGIYGYDRVFVFDCARKRLRVVR